MSYSLQSFELHDMLRCGLAIRRASSGARSMQEAALAVVGHLYEQCVDPSTGTREIVLVRLYKTHPYGRLPPELQEFARARLRDGAPSADLRCLVLLASAGDLPEWNDVRTSRDHRAIPLPSEQLVDQAPMIAGLIRALGLEIRSVVAPGSDAASGSEGKTYNIFYVKEAQGSPLIPAQETFVVPHGVRSVVGFGGLLLDGDLYTVVMFTRVPIPETSATRFRNIALDLRVALSGTESEGTFVPSTPPAAAV